MTGSTGTSGATPINDVGEAFAWPFHGPDWFGRMVLQGLIYVIPIIGWISLGGWMMRTIDNFRAGRRELAPAGFHLARGLPVSFTFLIYGVLLNIPGGILDSFAGPLNSGVLNALGGLAHLLGTLFLAFLSPVLILFVHRGGFAAGFDLGGIWRTATGANTGNTFVAAAVIFAAGIIGGLGWILCLVGLLFTLPYQQAITSGAVTWYERVVGAGPAPAPRVTTAG